jgi:hypothetical protein
MNKENVIELNNKAAYIKNKPITQSDQMTEKLSWNKIDDEWKSNIIESKAFWYTGFTGNLYDEPKDKEKVDKIITLRDKLLTFGGEEACMPYFEEDINDILLRGQFWYADRVKFMKGERSQCHRNSCYLWEANKSRVRIVTGYALSLDGMWRQHSWAIWIKPRKNMIVETTEPRIAYFGFVMTEDECKDFLIQNT